MNLWQSFAGALEIELKCADPAFALSRLQDKGIALHNVRFIDELTVCFTVSRLSLKMLRSVADKRGFAVIIKEKQGIYWLIPGLLRRPVLLVGLLFLIILGSVLPTRVLFVQVEGNISVPTRLILEKAAQSGIGFWSSRAEVRSERMKNALLESLPQLQWAGVNTAGCVAVISVRERQVNLDAQENTGVASIVALRDGVITELTATKGNPLCKAGQAVKAGQILISGYTDCGFSIKAERAVGEIYGRTERDLTVIMPCFWQNRADSIGAGKKYALLIGKKRINLYFGSGILDSSCVKIYKESYMTLPGGFVLPIALLTESWLDCGLLDTEIGEESLNQAARRYLVGEMTAGEILSSREEISQGDGIWILSGRYACREMIGQLREEEIVKPNGTND